MNYKSINCEIHLECTNNYCEGDVTMKYNPKAIHEENWSTYAERELSYNFNRVSISAPLISTHLEVMHYVDSIAPNRIIYIALCSST